MDATCYILIALALVLGFIGGWSLWFEVGRYWERRAKVAEKYARHLPQCPTSMFPGRMTCTCGFSAIRR